MQDPVGGSRPCVPTGVYVCGHLLVEGETGEGPVVREAVGKNFALAGSLSERMASV